MKLKKSSLSILEMTPKLIDAVFGKLPGTLAEVAAKVGVHALESRRRVVIYDFESGRRPLIARGVKS